MRPLENASTSREVHPRHHARDGPESNNAHLTALLSPAADRQQMRECADQHQAAREEMPTRQQLHTEIQQLTRRLASTGPSPPYLPRPPRRPWRGATAHESLAGNRRPSGRARGTGRSAGGISSGARSPVGERAGTRTARHQPFQSWMLLRTHAQSAPLRPSSAHRQQPPVHGHPWSHHRRRAAGAGGGGGTAGSTAAPARCRR